MKRKTEFYSVGLSIAIITLIVGYFASRPVSSVVVYDSRFHILDHSINTEPIVTYRGNQTVACMKAKLSSQFGKKLFAPPVIKTINFITGGKPSFVLCYKGDFPFEELYYLKAVYTNSDGISIELLGNRKYQQPTQQFIITYYPMGLLPETSDSSFRIDFMLKSDSHPVATWRLGEVDWPVKEVEQKEEKETGNKGVAPLLKT